MVSKHNKMELFQKQVNKAKRYTLKKLTIGLASVAVGAVLFLGQSGDVYAAEEGENGVVSIQVVGGDLTVHEPSVSETEETLPGEGTIDISVSGGELYIHDEPQETPQREETPAVQDAPSVETEQETATKEHEPFIEEDAYRRVSRERANVFIRGMGHLSEEQKTVYLNQVNNASSVNEIERIHEAALNDEGDLSPDAFQPDELNPK